MKVILRNSNLTFEKEKPFTKVYEGTLSTTPIRLSESIASGSTVYCVISDPDNVKGTVSDNYFFEVNLRTNTDPTPNLAFVSTDIRLVSFPMTSNKKSLTFNATRIVASFNSVINNKLVIQLYARSSD